MLNCSRTKKKVGGRTNSSFLSLITKDSKSMDFSRFRPISLCNSSYKILTKILANQLKILLPKLISENQGGFMQNRQILDNVILVQEALHSSKESGERGIVINLDMANVFDRIRHVFLFHF